MLAVDSRAGCTASTAHEAGKTEQAAKKALLRTQWSWSYISDSLRNGWGFSFLAISSGLFIPEGIGECHFSIPRENRVIESHSSGNRVGESGNTEGAFLAEAFIKNHRFIETQYTRLFLEFQLRYVHEILLYCPFSEWPFYWVINRIIYDIYF